jgi:SpoVK/Ycf46/Vps4 family AAA+-type ATPase
MSALKNYEEQLKKAIFLARPLVHIETSDYDWDCKIIERLLLQYNAVHSNKERTIYSWSPHQGFRDESGNKKIQIVGNTPSEHIIETLDNFTELDGIKVLVVRDIAQFFESDNLRSYADFFSMLSSRLYDFYTNEDRKFTSQDKSIIFIVCPKFNIPIELQGYLYRLTPPFPDEEDIAHELGLDVIWEGDTTISNLKNGVTIGNVSPSNPRIFYRYGKSFFKKEHGGGIYSQEGFEENKKKILSAFRGMRIKAIQTLLSYNETPYEINGGDKSDFLLESKKRMVMDSGLLKLENVPEGYSKYVGDIDGLKDYINEVKTIIDNRVNYNEKMSMPKGILLVGPPGCGKSETSKAIADILKIPLLSLDMGSLMSKWSGEQEHNFENAIALAEAAQPCVLRIDELEKAFSGTGNTPNSDQSGVRVLGFFLTWMQERTSITGSKSLVYLVATANNLDELRPEFLRKGRWDEIFYLIYPTYEGMAKIIQSCLQKYNLSIIDDEDDISGDDEYIIIRKVTSAFFKQYPKCKISGAEIADAIERVYKKQFKRDPSKNINVIDVEEIKEVLEDFAKKNRNYELDRKVRDEIRSIQIEHQKRYHPLTEAQSSIIKDIIRKKYSKENIEVLIQQEIANLRVNHFMHDSTNKFNEASVSKAVRDKYTDKYIMKLVNDEHIDVTMSFHINNEPEIDPNTIKMLETKLREKFEDVQDYEEFYKSKGYKSASKL